MSEKDKGGKYYDPQEEEFEEYVPRRNGAMARHEKMVDDYVMDLTPNERGIPTIIPPAEEDGAVPMKTITRLNMYVYNMPCINMQDPKQVRQRITDYFLLCDDNNVKPTMKGLAMALNNMSRHFLHAVANDLQYVNPASGRKREGVMHPSCALEIKRAVSLLEMNWEAQMYHGKINPVTGIFLGKNNFGYSDKQEYVLTPNTGEIEQRNVAEIEAKYAELPED